MSAEIRSFQYYTADVFSARIFGGNPLAVVLDADDLDTPTMQRIAREFNYSETTFVRTPARDARDGEAPRFAVRIFTPQRELPFAGHPTIGTAAVLAHCDRTKASAAIEDDQLNADLILEEGVGDVAVWLGGDRDANKNDNDTSAKNDSAVCFARLEAAAPLSFSPETEADPKTLAGVLSLEPEDIGTRDAAGNEYLPRGASTGIPSLNVPVRDREALARARIRPDLWERDLKGTWAPDPYLFCFADGIVYARKFALTAGIGEDPATGSAATTLAGYLAQYDPAVRSATSGSFDWEIQQGIEMGRPSVLHARATKGNGAIQSLGVGGDSVIVCEGVLRVPL